MKICYYLFVYFEYCVCVCSEWELRALLFYYDWLKFFLTEMLKGVFTEIKNKFQAAVDILRKEKITLDPEDPAAVKHYANVMKTIRQK